MIITVLLFSLMMQSEIIYKFTDASNLSQWQIVNDAVMGGRSQGNLEIQSDGHARFFGDVSLENNGGFTLVQHRCNMNVKNEAKGIIIRCLGDGKAYQLRVRANSKSQYAYAATFTTDGGKWQEIRIPFSDLEAIFRGQVLNMPPFSAKSIQEIGLLIGNKQTEDFEILIDSFSIY